MQHKVWAELLLFSVLCQANNILLKLLIRNTRWEYLTVHARQQGLRILKEEGTFPPDRNTAMGFKYPQHNKKSSHVFAEAGKANTESSDVSNAFL